MSNCERLKEYEIAKDKVDKGNDIINSIRIIVNEYEEDEDFKEWINALDDIKKEIEESISEDVEIVDKYEKEEHDDEVRCMNVYEF